MLVKVTRSYSGREGRRVKMGTQFSVDVIREGYQTISLARYRQLKHVGLARAVNPADDEPPPAKVERPPRRGTAPKPANKVEPDSRPRPQSPRRASAKNRTQNEAPPEPRKIGLKLDAAHKPVPRNGGQTGKEQPASSSPVVRQVGGVTLTQRGTRRGQASAGSPSITPGSPPTTPAAPTSPRGSRRGQTSSTPATDAGGEPSVASPDSAAFD